MGGIAADHLFGGQELEAVIYRTKITAPFWCRNITICCVLVLWIVYCSILYLLNYREFGSSFWVLENICMGRFTASACSEQLARIDA